MKPKRAFTTFLFIWIGFTINPLQGQNFLAADKLALNTPPGKTISIPVLAHFLCAEQPDERHKIRALYAWVTLNIAYLDYNTEQELWATPEHVRSQGAEQVLKNRTAVCQGYANVFCALAKEAGLACEVVTGLIKNQDGEVQRIGHAWASARVAGRWYLFDPTWGVPPPGLDRWVVEDAFFMVDPSRFILDHLPDDPAWQLLENPITESQFRASADDEIQALLSSEPDQLFNAQDTLNQWIALDSVQRMLAAENRILRFNGSNERVVFGLGQNYWGLFFDIRARLDSLSDLAILTDNLELDTLWYSTQFELMVQYHNRARALFDRLESPERLEKANKFYTPADVAAILEKMRGDLHTAVFENQLQQIKEEVLSAGQLATLRYQANKAQQYFSNSEATLDCNKIAGSCFEISHNRSLMAIQLAQRQLRLAQALADDNTTTKNLKTIQFQQDQARINYQQALSDCASMLRRPPKFRFVEERLLAAQQGLLTLRSCELRVARTTLTPEVESLFGGTKFSAEKAEKLAQKMKRVAQSMDQFSDTLTAATAYLGDEFVKICQFNVQLESYALQFNLANLLFRMALNNYDVALTQKTFTEQRENIRAVANRGLRALREANNSLDILEDSGRLPAGNISQKQAQLNKLEKSLRDFLAGF